MAGHISVTRKIIDLRRRADHRIQRFMVHVPIKDIRSSARPLQPVQLIRYPVKDILVIEAVACIQEQEVRPPCQLHRLIHRIVDAAVLLRVHPKARILPGFRQHLDRAVRGAAVLDHHFKICVTLPEHAADRVTQPLPRVQADHNDTVHRILSHKPVHLPPLYCRDIYIVEAFRYTCSAPSQKASSCKGAAARRPDPPAAEIPADTGCTPQIRRPSLSCGRSAP